MAQFLQQQYLILAATLALFILILFWLVIDLRIKWQKLFGKRGPPDGKLLEDLLQRLASNEVKTSNLEGRVLELERIGKISVQKVGFLRFNPFYDTGGDQSFSLALLDSNLDGVVISSLYTREGTRVYAKEIKGGKALQALSKEEQGVLEEVLHKNF